MNPNELPEVKEGCILIAYKKDGKLYTTLLDPAHTSLARSITAIAVRAVEGR